MKVTPSQSSVTVGYLGAAIAGTAGGGGGWGGGGGLFVLVGGGGAWGWARG